MNEVYSRPDIYDITYSQQFEDVLKKYYKEIFSNRNINSIHDCSFGTGNLSLALSKLGYNLSGSDISTSMLKKAKDKIISQGLDIDLVESDFRYLSRNIDSTFDCVISTGNSLAHVNNLDIITTLKEMAKLIKPGGYIYVDSRNWDLIIKNNQRFYYYNPVYKHNTRINFMQVWDYNLDKTITFNLLYSFEENQKIIKREEFREIYHPFTLDFLVESLHSLNFENIEIYNFLNTNITDINKIEWYGIIAQNRNNV